MPAAVAGGACRLVEAVAVGAALRRVGVRGLQLRSVAELARFAVVGAVVVPFVVVAAFDGVRGVPGAADPSGRSVWAAWAADALGILVWAPTTTAALAGVSRRRVGADRARERTLAIGCALAAVAVYFGPAWASLPTIAASPHWLAAPLLWVALRSGRRGVLATCGLLSVLAVGGTVRGHGPFASASADASERAALVQVYVALCLVLTAAGAVLTHRLETLAHVVASRRRALGALTARVTREREHLQTVLDTMVEAVVVCDAAGRLVLHNRAAEPVLPLLSGWGVTTDASRAPDPPVTLRPDDRAAPLAGDLPLALALRGRPSDRVRARGAPAEAPDDARLLEANARTLRADDGAVRGAVLVLTDVTELAAAEAERARLVEDLRRTLAEVKVLRGILPICGYCRRIHDEQRGWTRLETFVTERSQASFSHGVCPECLERLLRGPVGRGPV